MCRAFDGRSVGRELLDPVLGAAHRAPSAGNTRGTQLVVLTGPATARYWDAALPPGPRRDRFAFPGLLRAPVLVIPCADREAYARRYREADKGRDVSRWPVPYWLVDAAFVADRIMLAADAVGLGVCFFGLFDAEPAVRASLGVPDTVQPVGVLAIGWPDPAGDRPGRSRGRPSRIRVHEGGWTSDPRPLSPA